MILNKIKSQVAKAKQNYKLSKWDKAIRNLRFSSFKTQHLHSFFSAKQIHLKVCFNVRSIVEAQSAIETECSKMEHNLADIRKRLNHPTSDQLQVYNFIWKTVKINQQSQKELLTDMRHFSFKSGRLLQQLDNIEAEINTKRSLMVAYLHYREKMKKLKPDTEKFKRNQQKLSHHEGMYFAWQSDVDRRSNKLKKDCESLLIAMTENHNKAKLDKYVKEYVDQVTE